MVLPVLGQLLLQLQAGIGCRGIPAVTPVDALERGFKISGDLTAEEPDHGIGKRARNPWSTGVLTTKLPTLQEPSTTM